MRRSFACATLAAVLTSGPFASAQSPAGSGQPFAAGAPLKTSPNVKVFGSFRFSESLSYDEARDLYVSVPQRCAIACRASASGRLLLQLRRPGAAVLVMNGYIVSMTSSGALLTPAPVGWFQLCTGLTHPATPG